MKIFKNPIVAVLLTILIVLCSTTVSISVKLNNKCEEIVDEFYNGVRQQGVLRDSIYDTLVQLSDLAGDVVIVAENYGLDTRELTSSLAELRQEISYHNEDIDSIYDSYEEFYNALRAVELGLSSTGLSQRHVEYMTSASEQISTLKYLIDNSGYNDSVRNFYKKFDRFPVNVFAGIFDVDYPDYFA